MNTAHRVFTLILAAALLVALTPVSRAEVAAMLQSTTGGGTLAQAYEISPIVDDPDPMGQVWIRYNDDSVNRVVLNPEGALAGDGRPAMGIGLYNRAPLVVWAKNAGSDFDVVLSRFVGGAWSAPLVLAGSSSDERDPSLVVDPLDGTVHVFYWIDDADPRVLHRQAPADLSSWTLPQRVSPLAEACSRPTAVFHNGTLKVVFESHGAILGGTPRQIVMATSNGAGFDHEVLTTTAYPDPNWPQAHSRGGKLWVDWVDDAGQMTWVLQPAGGSWDPAETEYFTSVEERDYHVRGAIRAQVLEP